MDDLYSFFMISGELEKIYMGFITAIGYASAGSKVYMFFTMDALKALTKESEKMALPNAKPLKFYIDSLIELGENDVEIVSCEFGMRVKGYRKEDLLPFVKISGVSEFALKSSESKAVLVF
ncbi:peroxiredoxin [Sulfolobus acidocaldarius SUSAZ]|nr:peroxiredoxin [Sulfolobus acidocaldarius SUSAZ]